MSFCFWWSQVSYALREAAVSQALQGPDTDSAATGADADDGAAEAPRKRVKMTGTCLVH